MIKKNKKKTLWVKGNEGKYIRLGSAIASTAVAKIHGTNYITAESSNVKPCSGIRLIVKKRTAKKERQKLAKKRSAKAMKTRTDNRFIDLVSRDAGDLSSAHQSEHRSQRNSVLDEASSGRVDPSKIFIKLVVWPD